jgi:protein phosphatase
VLERFSEGEYEYLIESAPLGQVLWDAWDEPQYRAQQRFGWLKQIAGALHRLHESGAILEGLRPDIVTITAGDQATITDLSDLLPLPLPPDTPIKATYYTAPELVLFSEKADARSDLYSFGAMLYALQMGRELTELDFELQGVPRSLYQRFPDIHPLFGRLVSKTFCRELARRFPTEDAAREDATGFAELIRTLETCRRTLDHVRLDIAAWTTTGMIRTGNEDAFALLHATESSENTLGDCVLVLLADGMGGYEAGEVAAAMAIGAMRKFLLAQQAFAPLAGEATPLPDEKPLGDALAAADRGACRQLLAAALKQANKDVYMAAHGAAARRGMGCTAEAVYVSRSDLVVGHVGDSRTYHLQAGVLTQVTKDQTWVNRMVELGAMTPQDAEQHPRRSELQQAIGGYPDVDPALYDATLKPGDWVVICSDGLSNHVDGETLKDLLQRASSAESAARRLVNLANLDGATDNATVVVIRAT